MRTFFLVVALLAGGTAHAATFDVPRQSISGDLRVDTGDLAILLPSPIEPTPSLHSVSYDWKVLEPDFSERRARVEADGVVIFGTGSRPRTLKAICSASYLFVVRKGEAISEVAVRTAILTADVVVGGGPTPTPPPAPTPPGPLPDGKYGLAKAAYDAAMATVLSETRARDAAVIAGAMEATRAEFGKSLRTTAEAERAIHEANTAALLKLEVGGNWVEWGKRVGDAMRKLFLTGKMKVIEDYGQAVDEITTGLRAIR